MNNIDEILEQMEELLDKSAPMPFSQNKMIIDAERLRELIDDIRLNIPQEIKRAKLIDFDCERIIKEAEQKAEQIVQTGITVVDPSADDAAFVLTPPVISAAPAAPAGANLKRNTKAVVKAVTLLIKCLLSSKVYSHLLSVFFFHSILQYNLRLTYYLSVFSIVFLSYQYCSRDKNNSRCCDGSNICL